MRSLWLCLVLVWSMPALAAVTATMTPNTLDTGYAAVGQPTPGATGTLSASGNIKVDFVIGSCSGGNVGTFSFSPGQPYNLNGSTIAVTATYTPTAPGRRTCTVNIVDDGMMMNVVGSFTVIGSTPPQLSVNPASGNFAAVRFNDASPIHTSAVTFTVTNTGSAQLSISNASIGGANAGDFAITTGLGTTTLNPGFQTQLTVTFNPSAAGARNATLSFASNDPGSPTNVALTGQGQNATISVTGTLDFTTVLVGSSSPLNAVVTNNGGAPKGNLYLGNSTITGGVNTSWFTFSQCGTQTCNLNTFVASTANVGIVCTVPPGTPDLTTASATVTFGSDSDTGGGNTTTVSCKAGQSNVAAAPSTVQFNGNLVNTTSAPISVTVGNTGSVAYGPFWFDTAGNPAFSVTCTSGCGGATCTSADRCSIGPGSVITPTQMTFSVTFHPTQEIAYSQGLALRLSAGAPVSLTLAGRGIDKHIQTVDAVLAADTYKNPMDKATIVAVPVMNTGEYQLHITSMTVSGDPVWSIAEPSPDVFVDGLSSRDVMIRFSPVVAGKAPTGQLTLMCDDTLNPVKIIRLDGNGKDRNVTMDPGSVPLFQTGAGVPIKLSTFADEAHPLLTITNVDPDSEAIGGFTIRAFGVDNGMMSAFSVKNLDGSDVKDVPLAFGDSKQFDVIFAPDKVGQYDSVINLYLDKDPDPQRSKPVDGTALYVSAHGSSLFGCSAGGGGSGALVALALCFSRRRRRRT